MSAESGARAGKVVIIGGGVSGLAAGCLLAGRGLDVTVLEANRKAGGSCATTTVDGYVFHDGAIYVALTGLLEFGFSRLGLDWHSLVPLRKITSTFSVDLPDGVTVTLRDGLDVRVEGAAFDAARLDGELRRMLARWKPVLDMATEHLVTQPYSAWSALRYGWKHLHKLRGTLSVELQRSITDERIRTALAATVLHAGLGPDRAPVSSMLGIVSILTDGLFLPEGGMGRIPDALLAAFEQRGGTFRACSPVTRIEVDGGRARGVQLGGGERIEARAVISTVSPMSTFTSLVESGQVPAPMAQSVRRARLSHRAVNLQLGLANELRTRALMNIASPLMERQGEVVAQDPLNIAWPVYSAPTQLLPELAPRGGSVVEMFVPVKPGLSLDNWGEAERRRFIGDAIACLRRRHDIDVAVTRMRTPGDFRDQMHLYQGALYGLSPAVPPQQQFAQTSPIGGLFLGGQCTYPGYGVGPSVMSGIFAADALLGTL